MLANPREQQKRAWPEPEREEIDRVVEANAQQAGNDRASQIESVMIA